MRIILPLSIAFSLLMASCATAVQPPAAMLACDLPYAEQLQETLNKGLAEYDGIGLAASILVPGYETCVVVAGVSHGDTPITADTLFSAGSITKNFTAVTVLKLADEGLLSLDDTVAKWLPGYPNIDPSITVRQLLNHTSGIFNFTENQEYWEALFSEPEKVTEFEQILQGYVLEPYFSRGTDWHYSNTGYILLRMIIMKATGLSLSEQYRNRLWEPLGLEAMFLAGEETLPDPVAHGWYEFDGDGNYDDLTARGLDAFYTGLGGGVYATPGELAEWAQALFAEGRVLSPASLELMLDFHFPTPGEPLVDGYGLGVVRFSPDLFNGLEIWGHGGHAPGYAAGMMYLPENKATVVIMDNTADGKAMFTINNLLSVITANQSSLVTNR